MKKYDLIDTVSRGSNARKEINPQLIVDTNGIYEPGCIFDANATKELVNSGISSFIGDAPDTLDTLEEIASKIQELDNIGFSDVALSGDYSDLINTPTIPTVPTTLSSFTDDLGSNPTHTHSQYLTQHQDISNYVQKSQTTGLLKNDGTVDTNTYLTSHQDISGKADKSEMSVVDGTGDNIDKTTITLKSGTSATVLKSHQSLSGYATEQYVGTQIATQHENDATLADVAALESDNVPPISQQENVIVLFRQYTDLSQNQPGVGVSVSTTVDGTTSSYTSGQTGTVSFNIPIGKTYILTVTPPTGYYVHEGRTTFTMTAEMQRRSFTIRLMPYQTGLFIVDSSGHDYRFDDWKTEVEAGRKSNSEAKLIKIASAQLCEQNGVFGISIDDMRDRNFETRSWGPDNYLISPPGVNMYTYNGLTCTELLLDTAANDNKYLPAATLAYSKKITIGNVDLQGFLGSSNQWSILWESKTAIDEILTYTRPEGSYLLSTFTTNKWTSTQSGANNAYYWTDVLNSGTNKTDSYNVVPFFAF